MLIVLTVLLLEANCFIAQLVVLKMSWKIVFVLNIEVLSHFLFINLQSTKKVSVHSVFNLLLLGKLI